MRTLLSYCCVVMLCACGPYIDTNRGIVSGGFMSKSVAFAGKMKSINGAAATWSMTGTDSTEVPIAGINALGTAIAIKGAFKTVQSNNELGEVKAKVNTKATAPTVGPNGEILQPVFPPQQ